MEPMDRQQHWELWGVAAIVTIAVVVGLVLKGISGAAVVDAVKDIGEVLIPILAAVLAARLVIREMDPESRFVRAGENALETLQSKHPTILSGPKPNTKNYDPDNPGKAGRYLFIQKNHKGDRSQLVPVLPFKIGVVEVRVSKMSLKLLGLADELEPISARVAKAVAEAVQKTYDTASFEILDVKNERVSIAIDFDEGKQVTKGFKKAVALCANTAMDVLGDEKTK